MTQTFGGFIRQKRKEKMLRLNAFAKQIGISNVYLSYLESGKRPAPSQAILNRIAQVLALSPKEEAYMNYLATLSRSRFSIPENVMKFVKDVIREILPENVKILDGNEGTLNELMRRTNLKPEKSDKIPPVEYFYSGKKVSGEESERLDRYLKRLEKMYSI